MVGWHHQLNGHESEQTRGDSEGQGSLACCSPWGCKESDMTQQLNNNLSFFFLMIATINLTFLKIFLVMDHFKSLLNLFQYCFFFIFQFFAPGPSLVAQMVKNLHAMWETQVRSLGQKNPLEKEMATHSSILAWRIPWTEDPGGLQTMGSQRVGHD